MAAYKGCSDAFVSAFNDMLSDGDYAVGFFNFGNGPAHVELHFWDIGLPLDAGYGMRFTDCLEHRDMVLQTEYYSATVESHGCRLYRCRPEVK